jgi:hypothetical protein
VFQVGHFFLLLAASATMSCAISSPALTFRYS